jgi:hypothetical protein
MYKDVQFKVSPMKEIEEKVKNLVVVDFKEINGN